MRVLVAVAVRLYRESLAGALAMQPGVDVVGVAEAAGAAVAAIQDTRPTVVVIDVALVPGLTAPDDLSSLATVAAITPLVAVGIRDDAPQVVACARLGVAGYVHRDATVDELVKVLFDAERGEDRCSALLPGLLVRRIAELAATASAVTAAAGATDVGRRLTSRELEVVRLVEEGLMNKQIARRLGLSLSTVKNHVHNALEKLQLESRDELACWHRARFG